MTETDSPLGFTTEEAARMLHMAPYTLREKVRDRKIGSRRYAGRFWFSQDDIDNYLRDNLQVNQPIEKEGPQ